MWSVLPVSSKAISTHFIFASLPPISLGTASAEFLRPGTFGSSAFPFPPKNSSRAAAKTFCAPPEMQTLALGADPSRFRVPQLQGQKRRFTNVRIC